MKHFNWLKLYSLFVLLILVGLEFGITPSAIAQETQLDVLFRNGNLEAVNFTTVYKPFPGCFITLVSRPVDRLYPKIQATEGYHCNSPHSIISKLESYLKEYAGNINRQIFHVPDLAQYPVFPQASGLIEKMEAFFSTPNNSMKISSNAENGLITVSLSHLQENEWNTLKASSGENVHQALILAFNLESQIYKALYEIIESGYGVGKGFYPPLKGDQLGDALIQMIYDRLELKQGDRLPGIAEEKEIIPPEGKKRRLYE